MNVRRIAIWISGVSVIALIALLCGRDELHKIISSADRRVLVGLCLLQVATVALGAYQWRFLFEKAHVRLPFKKVFTAYLAGSFIESVTPSVKMGGEAARVYFFRRISGLSYTKITGVLLIQKYLSMFPFIIICAALLFIASLYHRLPASVYLAFLCATGMLLFLFMLIRGSGSDKEYEREVDEEKSHSDNWKLLRRAIGFIKEASESASGLTGRKDRYCMLIVSTFIWALYPLKVAIVVKMLGLEVSFLNIALATYVAYLVSMIPLLPGGLGTFEGSMVFMFSISGLAPAEGLSIALISRTVTYWFPLVFSACALLWVSFERNLKLEGAGGCSEKNLNTG